MDPEANPLILAIQPWIDAYDTPPHDAVSARNVTLPSITTDRATARQILKALTGDPDA